MSDEQISTAARLNAERLMSGRKITEDEMRVIMAGLLLSVDRLTNALVNMEARLWSEAHLREMIGEEITKNCKAHKEECPAEEASQRSATWFGRLFRSMFGAGCAMLSSKSSGL